MAFFNPFIFPPAAMKQAQPRTPTYQNIPIIPVTFTHTATAGSANRVEKFSGDGQSAVAGSELPNPLVVQVLDAVAILQQRAASDSTKLDESPQRFFG